ncbi:MAG TPA: hypothetical protein VGY99_16485 [Candidatus Binataceae bacterium]|jgi:hypothetical protein|nr:hypothetical protein [Candidatus Binataceae bacterium]
MARSIVVSKPGFISTLELSCSAPHEVQVPRLMPIRATLRCAACACTSNRIGPSDCGPSDRAIRIDNAAMLNPPNA